MMLVVWEEMRVLVMQWWLVGAGCVCEQVLQDGQGPEQGITAMLVPATAFSSSIS